MAAYPDKQQMLYGRQPVLEMLESGHEVEKIWLQKGAKGNEIRNIRALAKNAHVPVQSVPQPRLNRLTGKNHQGVVAFAALIDYYRAHDVLMQTYEKGEVPLFVALDGVTDVRNFGAVARTAECFGVHTIITGQADKALINAEAMKASSGALSRLPVCREPSLADAFQELTANGLAVMGTDTSASDRLQDNVSHEPVTFVFGAEGEGLSKNVQSQLTTTFRIPMVSNFNSLNVSVAAGIVLYEARRSFYRL